MLPVARIDTVILIAKKDLLNKEGDKAKFKEINTGTNQFVYFVFVENLKYWKHRLRVQKLTVLLQ